jgi:hypothetical protein
MFDKETGTVRHLPIKQVAQAPGFYADDVEVSLNEEVEKPGNDVIDKIRRGDALDEMDRRQLSYYIGTMIRRVPRARMNAEKLIPQALADVTRETKDWFKEAARAGHIDEKTLTARLAEADAVEAKFQKHPPEEVRKSIETPWPFESMLVAVYSMHWRLLRAAGPSSFLTSDNPASFFERFGLGHAECELILPLCSDLLLHCSWQGGGVASIVTTKEGLVKEFNRRTALSARRFVFYHKEAHWVLSAAKNKPEQLSRINWV